MQITHLNLKIFDLELSDPFAIAHGTSHTRRTVVVELLSENLVGYGEAAVVPYYPETEGSIVRNLEKTREYILDTSIGDVDALCRLVDSLPTDNVAAKSALDIALWDLFGKTHNASLSDLLHVSANSSPSSLTISFDWNIENYRKRIAALKNWPILKLKLGSGSLDHDLKLVNTAADTFPGQLVVDVNGGWSVDQAIAAIPRLAPLPILYIEQPVKPAHTFWQELRRHLKTTTIPLIADESFQQMSDVKKLDSLVDGFNIKLRKTGGFRAANQSIQAARKSGHQVVLGCMIESSVAVSAAAQLAPLADFIDLDAPVLVANDPFAGVSLDKGILRIPSRPGHGAIPRQPLS